MHFYMYFFSTASSYNKFIFLPPLLDEAHSDKAIFYCKQL